MSDLQRSVLQEMDEAITSDHLTPGSGAGLRLSDREAEQVLPGASTSDASQFARGARMADAARRIRDGGRELTGAERTAERQGVRSMTNAIRNSNIADPQRTQDMFTRFLMLKGGGDVQRGMGVVTTELNAVAEQLQNERTQATAALENAKTNRLNARTRERELGISYENAISARMNAEAMQEQVREPWEKTLRGIFGQQWDAFGPGQKQAGFEYYLRMTNAWRRSGGPDGPLDDQIIKANAAISLELDRMGYNDALREHKADPSNKAAIENLLGIMTTVMRRPDLQDYINLSINGQIKEYGDGASPGEDYLKLWRAGMETGLLDANGFFGFLGRRGPLGRFQQRADEAGIGSLESGPLIGDMATSQQEQDFARRYSDALTPTR